MLRNRALCRYFRPFLLSCPHFPNPEYPDFYTSIEAQDNIATRADIFARPEPSDLV